MTDLVRVPKSDQELIDLVNRNKKRPIVDFLPDDLAPEVVVRFSKSAASLLKRNDGERAICFSVLGRLHWLARKSLPQVLKKSKCENLRAYEDTILGCSEHRTTLWKFSSAYELDPQATPERLEAIGSEKLAIAAREFKGKSEHQKAEALNQAEQAPSVEAYRKWVETQSGVSGPGETQSASFNLFGSKAEIDEFKGWLADQQFREWAGTDKPIGMTLASIHASTADWDSSLPVGEILQAVRQFIIDRQSTAMAARIMEALEKHDSESDGPAPHSPVQPEPADENNPKVDW